MTKLSVFTREGIAELSIDDLNEILKETNMKVVEEIPDSRWGEEIVNNELYIVMKRNTQNLDNWIPYSKEVSVAIRRESYRLSELRAQI